VAGSEGTFTLSDLGGSGPYQISGGQDVGITGNPTFAGNLIAPENFTVATPLSTLISALIDPNLDGDTSDGTTVAAAETSVKTALGLTGVADLSDYDPVALAAAGDATALNVLKQGQYVATLLVESSGGDLTNLGSIAGQLAIQMQTIATQISDGTLAANYVYDLTDTTTIDNFLSSAAAVLGSSVVDTSVTAAIVSTNAIIAAATDLDSLSTGLAAAVNESGVALKGPLHKATVFADYNGDGELTAGEAYTTTASDGSYALNATVKYKDTDNDGLHDDTGEAIDTTGFDTLDYSIVVQMGADTIDYSTGESYANAGVSL